MSEEKISVEKKKNKVLTTIIFILINISVIAWIAFREFGGNSDKEDITQLRLHPVYIILGILVFALAVYCEYFKYDLMIRKFTHHSDRKAAYEVAVWGKYYDNLTPLGAGGQPFQVSYLIKNGYDAGTASALPIIGFLSLQFSFVFIALAVMIDRKSVV